MLERKIEKTLSKYYKDPSAPIMIVDGARQVGKTYIIRQTASKYFKNYIEINLQNDFENTKSFDKVRSVETFEIVLTSLYGANKLGNINNTIIFLDEIQVYPHLITLLKPLKQQNKYRFIASGSLLGITLKHIFIPMGSIQEVNLYPLDFEEFLWATKKVGKNVIEYLKQCYIKKESVTDALHPIMMDYFKKYLLTGGLPDAVLRFVDNLNITEMRNIQSEIIQQYKADAAKYDSTNNLKIRRIYDLMPSYMENKVKRVKVKDIEENKKAEFKNYIDEFDYLINSGVALATYAISNPSSFPLLQSMSKNLVKLYFNDVGLLTNILYKNNVNAVLYNQDNNINLGSVYETVVATELKAHGHELYYFDSKKIGEVDFLINDYDSLKILPIEIKSGKDSSNFKALPKLISIDSKVINKGYIFYNENEIKEQNNIFYFPIYLIMFL